MVSASRPHFPAGGSCAERETASHDCALCFLRVLVALALALAPAACATYEPEPLDADAVRAAFEARRLPDAEGARDFAKRLAALAPGSGVFDATDGVSVDEGRVVALFFNPSLRIARARAAVALAGLENAGAWRDPEISVDALRVLGSVADPWILAQSLAFSIPLSGRPAAERARAGAEHRQALAQVLEEEWQTATDVRLRWCDWSADRLRADLARDSVEDLRAVSRAVEALVASGEADAVEAALLGVALGSREAELRAASRRAAEGEAGLRVLMGLHPEAPVSLRPALVFPPPPAADPHAAIARHPRVLAARETYDVAEASLRLETARSVPDLSIGPLNEFEDDLPRVGVSLSIPLPLFDGNARMIAVARAERDRVRAEHDAEVEKVLAELALAERRHSGARAEREAVEAALVPVVEGAAATVRRVVAAGEAEPLVLLEHLTRGFEARLRLIDARLEEARAAIALLDLVGPPPVPASPETRP